MVKEAATDVFKDPKSYILLLITLGPTLGINFAGNVSGDAAVTTARTVTRTEAAKAYKPTAKAINNHGRHIRDMRKHSAALEVEFAEMHGRIEKRAQDAREVLVMVEALRAVAESKHGRSTLERAVDRADRDVEDDRPVPLAPIAERYPSHRLDHVDPENILFSVSRYDDLITRESPR